MRERGSKEKKEIPRRTRLRENRMEWKSGKREENIGIKRGKNTRQNKAERGAKIIRTYRREDPKKRQ